SAHLPRLVEDGFRLWGQEIDEAMPALKTGVDRAAPGVVQRHKLHRAFPFTHVPEVRLPALELRLGPREPEPVVMDVVRRVIVGDDFTRRREDRVDVTAAREDRLDVGAWQFRLFAVVAEEAGACEGDLDRARLALRLHPFGVA